MAKEQAKAAQVQAEDDEDAPAPEQTEKGELFGHLTDADKAGLLEQLLGGKALPATVTLAKQALSGTYGTVTAAPAGHG